MEKIAVYCSWADAQLTQNSSLLQLPPEVRSEIINSSGPQYLDTLSHAACTVGCTDEIFVLYNNVFVDLVNRWDASVTENLPEAIAYISSLARVLPLAPFLKPTMRDLLRAPAAVKVLARLDITSDELNDDLLTTLLLAFFRLLSHDREFFEDILKPAFFSSLLNHQAAEVRYLAVECLCLVMNFADAFCESLLHKYVGQQAVISSWEGQHINFRTFKLWEEQRWQALEEALDSNQPTPVGSPVAASKLLEEVNLHSRTVLIGEVLYPGQGMTLDVSGTFVRTANAQAKLTEIGTALLVGKPILITGPSSSGKTALISEVARIVGKAESMITLHLNEQTDAKSLIGMHTSSPSGNGFIWQPGVLTRALQQGRWVVIEDIDQAPAEVLGVLRPVIENGGLFIASRKQIIRAASGFQVIATIRSNHDTARLSARSAWLENIGLWQRVRTQSYDTVATGVLLERLYPALSSLLDTILNAHNDMVNLYTTDSAFRSAQSRTPSLRDLLKWCARIHHRMRSREERQNSQAIHQSFKLDIFKDALDCYGSYLSDEFLYNKSAASVAQSLDISPQQLQHLLNGSTYTVHVATDSVKIGRTALPRLASRRPNTLSSPFADTTTARRCLESICAGLDFAEPFLLVGETGVGKTSLVQHIATLVGQRLTVINLSQQSEATDLLGGLKPVTTRSLVLPLIEQFNTLFDDTFSASKNEKFQVALSRALSKQIWSRLLKLWEEAIGMADSALALTKKDMPVDDQTRATKRRRLVTAKHETLRVRWAQFKNDVLQIRPQIERGDQNHTFAFVEGRLIQAVRNGEWVLLDEINLASSDTLDHILSLLKDGPGSPSILLTESGNVQKLVAHPAFRVFAAMNPATDTGKKDLSIGIRSRFTELYVGSGDQDLDELIEITQSYLGGLIENDRRAGPGLGRAYLEVQKLNQQHKLTDGAGDLPHFSLRSLVRCLLYTAQHTSSHGLRRAMYEGFAMSFFTVLSRQSEALVTPILVENLLGDVKNIKSYLAQQPKYGNTDRGFIAFQHHIISKGPLTPDFQAHYIRTPSVERNLVNLARAASMLRFPILLQGPTSAGKTSMVEYLAKLSGNKFVRINNHEHTDLQEYLGNYSTDSDGKLRFKDGVLVDALRHGHWVVLDELNLAPSDVLEALNRLLDDNRELLIPETQEIIRPHPNFLLFATQNPAGLYGGRKRLSRAFRNRFLEIHFDDIPEEELEVILRERAQIAPSFSTQIVAVYNKLSLLRQAARLFEQKNSFATLRDLFRWASRPVDDRQQLAYHGFMLLGERVRDEAERELVKATIEETLKVSINEEHLYDTTAVANDTIGVTGIVWTRSMRRLFVLVTSALKRREPILLVGETGCGKTQICQVVAAAYGRPLNIYNAHTNTETGDLIGSQRPIRSRAQLAEDVIKSFRQLTSQHTDIDDVDLEDVITKFGQMDTSGLDPQAVSDTRASIAAYRGLFEWSDGSLVRSMRSGEHFLLDEISLADDSVLERLNSVLEPARTILLAEKGSDNNVVIAHLDFQFLATMNPGGDYGKRELSAALRNRLTEIWVPPLSEEDDILPILEAKLSPKNRAVATLMLKFAGWFGGVFHTSVSSTVALRDLLAWAGFIERSSKLSLEHAFLQGAAMVYIDSIGANPAGMNAITQDTQSARKKCLVFLQTLVSLDVDSVYATVPTFKLTDEALQVGDFALARSSTMQLPETDLVFEAPTTLRNSMRLVRALQMDRPILLEGSPGVGKTAIVTALAQLLGRAFTRINLSDQTDLMDLFGADAPAENQALGRFNWRDGPLLTAMQTGSWVLLDEMNLASQSVLEGLNACLDHRKEAYIAELDKTVTCHPDFVLFAAQNPHHQGGGRKGLPASFVNRFTVVYADPFQQEDLVCICRSKYPAASQGQREAVVRCVSEAESLISRNPMFGQGGPWELNLRDVDRWLQLCNEYSDVDPLYHCNTIVQHRFRDKRQEVALNGISSSLSPNFAPESYYPRLTPSSLQIGLSWLHRNLQKQSTTSLFAIPTRQLPQAKSVITAITHAWPVILAGPAGSGKTQLIRSLAAVSGAKLVEISMNTEIDTLDLLGGFEQYDAQHQLGQIKDLASKICETHITQALTDGRVSPLSQVFSLLYACQSVSFDSNKLLSMLLSFPDDGPFFLLADRLKTTLELSSKIQARFVWNDGVLVDAVRDGNWLVLDNANLCNASVLDRLNSLLEPGGRLLISEQHNAEGGSRGLKPHPGFRVFLTMDPRYGELSRAMRNRSLEVYLDADKSHRATHRGPRYPWTASISQLRSVFNKVEPAEALAPFMDNLALEDNEIIEASSHNDAETAPGFSTTILTAARRGSPLERTWLQLHNKMKGLLSQTVFNGTLYSHQPQLLLLNEHLFAGATCTDEYCPSLYWLWQAALHLSDIFARINCRSNLPTVFDRSINLSANQKHRVPPFHRFADSISKILLDSVNQALQQQAPLTAVRCIMVVASYLKDMLDFSAVAEVDMANLQALLQVGSAMVQEIHRTHIILADQVQAALALFKFASLQCGLSLQRMWRRWKPQTAETTEQLVLQMEFEDVVARFDEVSTRLPGSLAGLTTIRTRLLGAASKAWQHTDGEAALTAMKETMSILEKQARHSSSVSISFQDLFDGVSRRIIISDDLPTPSNSELLLKFSSSRYLVMTDHNHESIQRDLQKLDLARIELQNSSYQSGRVLVRQIARLSDQPLRTLRRLQEECQSLSTLISPNISLLIDDLLLPIRKVVKNLLTSIILAHEDIFEPGAVNSAEWQRFDLTFLKNLDTVELITGTNQECSEFARIFEQHIKPALHLLSFDCREHLGIAVIHLALAALSLIVPDRPFDPAVYEYMVMERHMKRKAEIDYKISIQERFNQELMGQSSSLVLRLLEEHRSQLGAEPSISKVVRPEISELEKVQEVFTNILRTIVGSPAKASVQVDDHVAALLYEHKRVNENADQLIARLSKLNRAYDDLVVPVKQSLQMLGLGLSLMSLSQQTEGHSHDSIQAICARIPLLGGTPQEVVRWTASRAIKDVEYTVLWLEQYILARSLTSESKSSPPEYLELFDRHYQQWKARLTKDQIDAQTKSRYYSYRGEEQNDEDITRELAELFPLFEAEDQKPENSMSAYDGRAVAIKLAQLHQRITRPQNDVGSLRDLILAALKVITSRSETVLQEERFVRYLPGIFLQLEKEGAALTGLISPTVFNIYSDPSIGEAQKLFTLVQAIRARFIEINDRWPEHAVPPEVLTFSNELLDFPINTPLAKLLGKTEKLLEIIAQWQSVASREWSVATVMDDLTTLIISWRRLELASWSRLLDLEKSKNDDDAQAWYFIAYEAVIYNSRMVVETAGDVTSYAQDLARTIEEFLKTATLGQYVPRLRLLEALQVSLQEASAESEEGLRVISTTVASILTHYKRYVPHMETSLQTGRADLEKAVVEQIKLASWKDTNITALRESARRSHQKLFKIVRKYRALLGQQIASLKSEEFALDGPNTRITLEYQDALDMELPDALATCSQNIADWQSRPMRLRDSLSSTISMRSVYKNILTDFDCGVELMSFREELVQTIKRLRKETPSTLTDENAALVRHLRERKRRLLNDTIKYISQAGTRRNLAAGELEKQVSIASILASSPNLSSSTQIDASRSANAAFHELLDAMPVVRTAVADHSPDLTTGEVRRGIGYLEGLLHVTISQRYGLRKAQSAHQILSNATNSVQNLATCRKKVVIASENDHYNSLSTRLAWLPAMLDVACQVLRFQQTHGGLDLQELFDTLGRTSTQLEKYRVELASPQQLPSGLHTASDVQALYGTNSLLRELQAVLEEWHDREPNVQYLIDQLLPWLEAAEAQNLSNGVVHILPNEIDRAAQTAANATFVALQQLADVKTTLPIDTEESSWLMRSNRAFTESWNALHIAEVAQKVQDALDQLQHASAADLTLSASMIAITTPMISQFNLICQDLLERQMLVHVETCRLTSFLAKTFVALASEGFCSPSEPSKGDEKEGKMESGTGLGDGEGAEDISKDVGADEDLSEFAKGEQEDREGSIEGAEDAVDMGMDDLEGEDGEFGEDKEQDEDSESQDGEDREMDEEAGSVDDLDPTAVDEKMWDDVKDQAEKDMKGEQGKGEKSNEQTAAEEGQEGEAEEGDLQEGDDAEEPDHEDDGTARAEGEHTDPHLQEEKALDLPEDMQLTGEEEMKDDSSDDGMEDLSDVEKLGDKDDEDDLGKDKEDFTDADEENGEETDQEGQAQDNEIFEDQPVEDETDKASFTEQKDDDELGEDAEAGGQAGAANQLQDQTTDQKAGGPNEIETENDREQQGGQAAENEEDGKSGRGNLEQGQGRETALERQQKEALKKLADVLDQWHQRREIFDPSEGTQPDKVPQDVDMADADFEHIQDNDEGDAQALGTAGADQAQSLDPNRAIQDEETPFDDNTAMPDVQQEDEQAALDARLNRLQATAGERQEDGSFVPDEQQTRGFRSKQDNALESEAEDDSISATSNNDDKPPPTLLPATNTSASQLWHHASHATHSFSLTLTEQLRLILHPTTATKLRGDFRTGKRLNLKRIIPYIASNYKRDKIWMRRSVPSKRSYQILLAVDDSKSMSEGGADVLALQTLALVCKSLQMLEVGDVSVLAFGNEVKTAFGFGDIWRGDESGTQIFQNFAFAQNTTDVRNVLERGLQSLRDARLDSRNAEDIWQLFLIISDGHCGDHEPIRRLIRRGKSERVLCVFVIVDGLNQNQNQNQDSDQQGQGKGKGKGESILDLKEAVFEEQPDGEMKVFTRRYLESFPFEFYLVVRDVRDLPGVLSRCLRGWFGSVMGT